LAVVGNIHLASINDMVWDGNKKLIVGSSDGFCSIISFDGEGEANLIGVKLSMEEIPVNLRGHYENLE
jgi:hypothetical protein